MDIFFLESVEQISPSFESPEKVPDKPCNSQVASSFFK